MSLRCVRAARRVSPTDCYAVYATGAIVHDLIVVRPDDVKEALALYQIDSEGLDRLDIAVLNASCATSTVDPWA